VYDTAHFLHLIVRNFKVPSPDSPRDPSAESRELEEREMWEMLTVEYKTSRVCSVCVCRRVVCCL